MQQFTVPQYIDVEDKIIGPITVRQFIILLVGMGVGFIAYKLADFALFIVEAVIIAIIVFILAFAKVNGRPVHFFFLNIIQTFKKPRLRVWDKTLTSSEVKDFIKPPPPDAKPKPIPSKKPVSGSHLAELSLLVDTGGVYRPDGGQVVIKPNPEG